MMLVALTHGECLEEMDKLIEAAADALVSKNDSQQGLKDALQRHRDK